ncbi:LytTR family DNA-binding domain-containing protein [Salipiger sp.]|uniref:LytTR family DNA-binding domain-containing protein n=1 Tax=Salipiger sp. TaxID=2078585 RepID=UPI003A983011
MHFDIRQPLNLLTSTFEPLELSVDKFVSLFQRAITWRYLGLVYIIVLAADPTALISHLPFPVYAGAWALGFIIYFLYQIALLVSLAVVRSVFPKPRIWWPAITLFSLMPGFLTLETVLERVSDDDLRPLLYARIVFVYITVAVFETIYLRFILPRVEQIDAAGAVAAPPAPPEPAPEAVAPGPPRTVHISGDPVALGDLQVIEARQHHVHIRLRNSDMVRRARLSDIVAQTDAQDGVQPHRSWWVARSAARGLERSEGRWGLLLDDGSVVPIARGRLADVQAWVETYLG